MVTHVKEKPVKCPVCGEGHPQFFYMENGYAGESMALVLQQAEFTSFQTTIDANTRSTQPLILRRS